MSNIKIAIKMRDKPSKKEQWKVTEDNSLQYINSSYPCNFRFDNIFSPKCRNCEVYATTVAPIVKLCLRGQNGTVLSYGQTSSASVSFIEIFEERVYDLLNSGNDVTVVDPNGRIVFNLIDEGVSVDNSEQTIDILFDCSQNRKSSSKDDRKFSSLSHTIFRITIDTTNKVDSSGRRSTYLQFVHVAGSELVSDDRMLDSQFKDADDTNKSLLWLNFVVHELSEGKADVFFDNSVLTQLIHESLGGNCNTAIICNIRTDVVDKTMSTLKFASQAKKIRNATKENRQSSYTDEAFVKIRQDESKFNSGRKRELDIDKDERNKRYKAISELLLSSLSTSASAAAAATSSSTKKTCGPSPTPPSAVVTNDLPNLDFQLQEIAQVKIINSRLMKELEEVKAEHENDTRRLNEQLNAAKLDLQKSELLKVQDEIEFNRMRNVLEQRNRELSTENEKLKSEKAAINLNSNDKARIRQLQMKNQANVDVIRKQNDMARCLEQQNYVSKQKPGARNFARPPVTVNVVESRIEQKIKRLENVMTKNIERLKNDFESEKVKKLTNNNGTVSHQMFVPNKLVGCIMGIKGETVRHIKNSTGTTIVLSNIKSTDPTAKRRITIDGTPESVQMAVNLIEKQIDAHKSKMLARHVYDMNE